MSKHTPGPYWLDKLAQDRVDLLDALRLMVQQYDGHLPRSHPVDDPIIKARAAIAKAEGQS